MVNQFWALQAELGDAVVDDKATTLEAQSVGNWNWTSVSPEYLCSSMWQAARWLLDPVCCARGAARRNLRPAFLVLTQSGFMRAGM
jgi:hypothetical protein